MAARKNRYRQFERMVTAVLGGCAGLYIVFLLSAGNGIIWLKALSAIIAILVSLLAIGYLYLTGELLRPRSLWMAAGFASVIICILVSLLCNFPSPNDLQPLNPLAQGVFLIS